MAVSLVQSFDGDVNGASLTVPLSGITANNLLILSISSRAGVGTTPSGWNFIGDASATYQDYCLVYWRIADGSETGVTYPVSPSNRAAAVVCEYSGAASTAPIIDSSIVRDSYGSGASASSGTISLTEDGWLLGVLASNQQNIYSKISSVTSGYVLDKRHQQAAITSVPATAIYSDKSGYSQPQTLSFDIVTDGTLSAAATGGIGIIAIKEAAGGGGTTISLDSGSFSLTGGAITPQVSRLLSIHRRISLHCHSEHPFFGRRSVQCNRRGPSSSCCSSVGPRSRKRYSYR